MATFKEQIEGLAGSTSGTEAEHWITDGVKAVVDRVVVYSPDSAYLFAAETESSYALGSVTTINGDGGSISASSSITIKNSGYTYHAVNGKTSTLISEKVTIKIGTSTVAVLEAGESVTLEESSASYSLSTASDPNADPAANYQIAVEWWTLTGSDGLPISELDKVLSVSRGSRVAAEIPPIQRFKAADTSSLQRASKEYPYYYKLNGKLYCLPAPDSSNLLKVSKVTYGQVNNWQSGSSTISNFPSGLWRLPVLYSAAKVLNEKLVGYQGLTSNTLSLPSLPTKPALEFSVAEALSSVDTSKLSISMPEYVSVADPTISSLDLTGITVTAAPEEPSFIYEDASLQEAFEDLSVNLQSTPPSYLAPVLVFPDAPTISNLTISSIPPVAPVAPSFSDPSIGATMVSSTTVSNAGTPPQYIPPVMFTPEFSTVDTLIEEDEDIELAGVKIQEISAQISEFSSELQNRLNVFNEENAEYQGKLQEAIQQAQIDAQKAQTQAQIDTTDKQQSANLLLQKENEEYAASLQKYNAEVQAYQANVSKEVQEYQQNLAGDIQVWQAERTTDLQRYGSDIQSALNTFNEENTKYQVDFQEAMKDFDGKLNRKLETMRQSTSVDLQNKAQRVQTQSGLYSARLQQYGTELQEFQAKVNREVQLYSLNELQHKLVKWQTDVSTNINAYQARVGAEIQSHAAEISAMSSITQTEAAHLGAQLQHESSQNTTKLNDYTGRIQEYAQAAQTEIARFNALMQEAQVQYQWYERQLAMVKEEYERGFEPFIRRENNAQQ
jgi:hypothetical protein